MKTWTIAGCCLWIIGIAVFIVGLNLVGNIKEWMTVAGSIVFLAGLGISGAVWMKNKKSAEETDKKTAADQ
jgi:hypothetical protein